MPQPDPRHLARAMQQHHDHLLARAAEHRRDSIAYLVADAIPDLTQHERSRIDHLLAFLRPTRPIADVAQRIVDAILFRREAAKHAVQGVHHGDK